MTIDKEWTLPAPVLDAVVAHARAELPDECCGLLLGDDGLIDEAWAARNLEASPSRFLIDPRDHFAAIHAARSSGRQVVGVYHSHPASPPVPSPTDLAEASYDDYLYLIVSLAGGRPEARLFRIDRGSATEIDVAG